MDIGPLSQKKLDKSEAAQVTCGKEKLIVRHLFLLSCK